MAELTALRYTLPYKQLWEAVVMLQRTQIILRQPSHWVAPLTIQFQFKLPQNCSRTRSTFMHACKNVFVANHYTGY